MRRTSPDTTRLSRAVSRPGIDPRIWLTLAVVRDVGFDAKHGVFVDVQYQPSGEQETAYLGVPYAGGGFGLHCPLNVDDTVLVAVPMGDPGNGPIVVARWHDTGDPPNAELQDDSDSEIATRDVVLRVQPGQRLRLITSADGDGVVIDAEGGGNLELLGAEQSYVRGEDYRDAESAFLDALETLVDAIDAGITSASGTMAGGVIITPAVTVFKTAVTQFKNAAQTYLSQRIKGE